VRRSLVRSSLALFVASLATGLLVSGAGADPTVQTKQAEAQAVLAQIREIDSDVGHAAEAYNLANIRLNEIRKDQARNERMLGFARTNLSRAQRMLSERLVAIYTSGESENSTLEVLLTATSIEDLLNRLEAVDRVSNQDAEVLRQVTSFRDQVKQRKADLARARSQQEQVVSQRAAQKQAIEAKLRERQALLSRIQDEIAKIQARERARQLQLARQVRSRLRTQHVISAEPAVAEAAAAAIAGNVPDARYGGVVGIAMRYLGIPYRWGGSSPSTGFDCSGFVMFVFSQVGVSLPHNAAAQYAHGTPVSRDQLQAGDLVFFDGLGHNGIYIGGGQFIHSPHTGDSVKISSLSQSWYDSRFVGGRRL
jgi:cell wall-associated NlpC family hydrolase